jgi:hypothetical protein
MRPPRRLGGLGHALRRRSDDPVGHDRRRVDAVEIGRLGHKRRTGKLLPEPRGAGGIMGILSWLFPSEESRLARARALMADGRHDDARKGLIKCSSPEAEVLYEACCKALESSDRASLKKQLAAQGFHGWKIEVVLKDPRRKADLERLIAREISAAGLDLGVPDIDQDAVKNAIARAERKAQRAGRGGAGTVQLVPIKEAGR